MKRSLFAALLLISLRLCGSADANWDKAWQRFEIRAHLDNTGAATISQRMTAKLDGDMSTLEVPLSTGPDQTVVLRRLVRESEDGERELTDGDRGERDRYDFTDGVLTWGIQPDDGQWREETIVFRVEYELRNALDPAWDIPIGTAHFAEWSEFWKFPARFREACRAWGDAGSKIARRYRYEHEITFPPFPASGPTETNYTLRFDNAWRQVHPDADLGRGSPESYRVSQLMEFLPPGRPSALALWKPAVRAGSIVAVAAAAVFLSLLFLLNEVRKHGLLPQRIDAAWFAENIARQPPEFFAWMAGNDSLAKCFPHFLARLRHAGVISIQPEPAASEDDDPKVSLRLSGNPAAMQPYEQEVLAALFPSGPESGTEVLAKHYAESGFNPEDALADAVGAQFRKAEPASRMAELFVWVQVALFCAGVPLVFYNIFQGNRDWRLCFNALGVGFGIAVIPLLLHAIPAWRGFRLAPLVPAAWSGLGVVAFVAVNFGTNLPLHVFGCAGLGLYWLCAFCIVFSTMSTAESPARARRNRDVALAVNYARQQLNRPHPALSDAWLPQLRALGLGRQIEQWRKRPAAGPVSDFPNRESPSSGLPPFTGMLPIQPEDEWTDALCVLSEEEAHELAEEEADDADDGKSA